MTHQELRKHALTKAVFASVGPIMQKEHDYKERHGRDAEYVPDEHAFYLMRVGNRLATLLSHCEKLTHAILFLSNYRETPATLRAGITRAKHLRYGIESYIVRTQTLYDLVLRLVDAVFHLTNADSQCRHVTIVQNLRVTRTDIPKLLGRLQKGLTDFRDPRHTVIHRGGYHEKDLDRVELCTELEEDYRRADQEIPAHLAFLKEAKREWTLELLKKRKAHYSRFNASAFKLVSDVLGGLHRHFIEQEQRLSFLNQAEVQ